MQKLPIGIQNFSDIQTENYCYADKTRLIARLIDHGKFYFLSRPRRFGKSLLIDTIAEAFLGNKKLFKGLYLENNWDWSKKHPVIRIDFAESILHSAARLNVKLLHQIEDCAAHHKIQIKRQEASDQFHELICKLHEKTGQRVAVLVDEYDKPILDNITDSDLAKELRNGLRNFYSVLKAQGAHLCFVMLTGVSKFSKVSLFSGLNNLQDITLDHRYGTLCGYTQEELETVFHEHLKNVDLNEVKKWYNGYNFLSESVYNPFDVLLYLDTRRFKPHWFETGTPTFLVDLIHKKKMSVTSLENLEITDTFMGSFDVDNIEPEPLLFQTGYLTILKEETYPGGILYTLGFPNHEVRYSFNNAILAKLSNTGQAQDKHKLALMRILRNNDLDKLKELFHAFFASIPNQWYRKNNIAGYEGYYCSIVYCYFTALGLKVHVEESTNHGQLDMAVLFNSTVYIIEFKVNELTNPGKALSQIKEKKYYEKYADQETYIIGIEFSKKDKNITRFEWEKISKLSP